MSHWSKIALGVVLAFVFVGVAHSQDDAKPKSKAEQRFDGIMADVQADMKKLQETEKKKFDDWTAAAEKAKSEGKPAPDMPAMLMGPPKELMAKFVGKFEVAAKEFAGTDDAIKFLGMIASMGGMAEAKDRVLAACKTLTTTHIKSEKLAEALPAIGMTSHFLGKEETSRILKKVEADSPHADVQAGAILARVDGDLRDADVGSPEYLAAKAEAKRATGIATDPDLKKQIQRSIDRREKLNTGTKADDIAGVDLNGVAFKLSDYKGKIIFLDFWGDW